MALNKWLGVAQPRIALKAFQPINVSPGTLWLLRVGGTNYQYTYSPSIIGTELTDQERAQVVTDGLAELYSGGGLGGGSTQIVESITSELVNGKWSLVARGISDGAPIDVEVSAVEAVASAVKVVELQTGRAAQNEKQVIRWPKTPTAGQAIYRYKNAVTGGVVYNANAASLQTLLEGLASIGTGNVSVSGSYTEGYTVEFIGTLTGQTAEPLIVHSTSSEGTNPVSYEITRRGGLSRTVYAMTALDRDSETVLQFTFDGETSHYFTGASNAETIRMALESIPGIGAGNANVSQLADGTWEIALVGKFIGSEVVALTLAAPGGTAPELTVTAGSTEKAQTVERITVENLPSIASGTVAFTYNGATSAAVTVLTADAAAITTALSGSGIPWQCTLLEASEGLPVVIELTANVTTDALDAGLVTLTHTLKGTYAFDVRVTQRAQIARNAIQQTSLHSGPDGGTFTLTYGANTTAGLAYNASAATIQSALEGLASIGAGNVAVDGNDGGPWVVTFQGSLAATAVSLLTGSGASLTITDSAAATEIEVQAPTGPNWWTNLKNWSLLRVPNSTDTVVFESGSVPCEYGISDVAAIAGLDVYRSYTGRIGRAEIRGDGSNEQLPQYLSLSDLGSKIAIRIGLGDEGDGPSIVRIDTKSQEADVSVLYSSQSGAETLYTIGLAGDLATVQVNSASVIFSGASGLVTTVDSLRFMPAAEGSSVDPIVEWGTDCTVDYVEMSGGLLRCGSVPSAIIINGGGASVRGTGNVNQISIRNAILRYSATGNLGLQGAITVLEKDIANDELIVTSAAHGLTSGDLVFVRGVFGFADKYHIISVVSVDKFALVGSDGTYIGGGTIDAAFFDDFFGGGTVPSGSSDGAKWGLADAVRIGVDGTIDFSELGVVRYAAAPLALLSETAVIHDPLITISDLRWHSNPGVMDEHYGNQGVFKREQSVAVSYNSASYVNGGGGVVGG